MEKFQGIEIRNGIIFFHDFHMPKKLTPNSVRAMQ